MSASNGCHPGQRSVLIVGQDFGDEYPCEGAEGTQIPLRGHSYTGVGAPNRESAGNIRQIESLPMRRSAGQCF
jgi:hypothetical protein